MIKLISKRKENILQYLNDFEGLNYNKIQALFRKRDVKVNGKRVDANYMLSENDEITLYSYYENFFKIKIIYEDENIIIIDKPKKLEVISETRDISLLNIINKDFFVVHRIDFNTEGLVVLAKNLSSKKELDFAFKNGLVNKSYITICKNIPLEKNVVFSDFLIKNENKVKVTKNKSREAKSVITEIYTIKTKGNYSLLNVNLKTGRTHQIRAHLAFHNLFVLGDDKYGDFTTNKKLNLKSQILKCYKLSFNFSENSLLSYLNSQIFKTNFVEIEDYFNNL